MRGDPRADLPPAAHHQVEYPGRQADAAHDRRQRRRASRHGFGRFEDHAIAIGEGGADTTGPNLYGVFGRKAGERPRYSYSNALRNADFVWDAERLDNWLKNPRTFLPGNKMTFPGLPDAKDRRDVIAFLKVETGYKPEPAPAS